MEMSVLFRTSVLVRPHATLAASRGSVCKNIFIEQQSAPTHVIVIFQKY